MPLKKILEAENRQTFLPVIVEKAVEYIDTEVIILGNELTIQGLDLEGIFRISARLTELQNVCKMIDDGAEINFYEFTKDPHLVAALLKKWFRERK